ncbi:MAG: hypothetical protein CMJ78_12435 [Planctomycetaceae bacterium]|nr:hypothetical protein [Planctomycetaceae bacterium]
MTIFFVPSDPREVSWSVQRVWITSLSSGASFSITCWLIGRYANHVFQRRLKIVIVGAAVGTVAGLIACVEFVEASCAAMMQASGAEFIMRNPPNEFRSFALVFGSISGAVVGATLAACYVWSARWWRFVAYLLLPEVTCIICIASYLWDEMAKRCYG